MNTFVAAMSDQSTMRPFARLLLTLVINNCCHKTSCSCVALLLECVTSPPAFTGLPDRIRVTLCVLMCTLLVVNPFNLLIKSSMSTGSDDSLEFHSGHSRTLKQTGQL